MTGGAPARGPGGAVPVVVRAVLRHPELTPAAVGAALRLAAPKWWRRLPPLPVPTEALWRFRMETAYGGNGDRRPDLDEVVSFVRWSRDMRHWRRT
jgi:hypothetical protein